jgi:poly-gamma-glutamate synthesis protein (capsule biosynthesis protein)
MSSLKILAVGDVFIDRPNPNTAFIHVAKLFAKADIVFGNCEGVYAEEWEQSPSCGIPLISDPKAIQILSDANFKIMSLANNHAVDGGYKALLATRDQLRNAGIAAIGAGENAIMAHQPAIME